MAVGFRIRGIFTKHVKGRELAALHTFKHGAQVPAFFRMEFDVPGFFKFSPQVCVFYMLEAGQAVRNCTHITATLDVVLPAQGIYATAIAAYVASEEREVDKRHHIVHGVVVFRDAQSPAELSAIGPGISMRGL